MQNNCANCFDELTPDDIGATKKLINRASEEFLCIPCLAKRFDIREERLREKIEYWRDSGCLLFSPKKEN